MSHIAWNKGLKMSDSFKKKVSEKTKEAMNRHGIREKISAATKSAMQIDGMKEKISIKTKEGMKKVDKKVLAFWKGKKLSQLHKQHQSRSLQQYYQDHDGWWKGKALSDKHKRAISISLSTPEMKKKLRLNAIRVLRKMKKKDTLPEIKMEQIIKQTNLVYKKQKPLCNITIVDFYITSKKLVIYADGDYWHSLLEYQIRDKKQNKILKENGYKVLRFWEHEINESPEKCLERVLFHITR